MKNKFNTVFDRLKEADYPESELCTPFMRKVIDLKQDFDEQRCWNLLFDNFEWLVNKGVITTNEVKAWFTEKELNDQNIFISGSHEVKFDSIIGLGDAKIHASGHSRVRLFDTAYCKAFDSTFVSGFGYSSFELNDCSGEAFQNCKVTAKGFSKIEAWDFSIIDAKNYSYVITHKLEGVTKSENVNVVEII